MQDDGSRGLDDQYTKSALARLMRQMSNSNKLSAHFDEIEKCRGHDMQSSQDPEEGVEQPRFTGPRVQA